MTDDKFIKLMRRISNARNLNVILPYAVQVADMIAEADRKKAEKYYEEGVKFLVGYTMHKDMSLDSVIDSFASIHRMNPAKAMQCVKPEYETYILTLIETLPNCISEKLFYGACKILVRLFEYDKERAKSLVVNLLSRFNLNETVEIYHFKCLSKDLNIIINLAEESGMNVTLYKEYCTQCNKKDTDRNLDYDKSKHQTIDFQNRVTLIMQLSKVPLTDAAIPLLINLMKELNENKQCTYLDVMMEVDYFGENSYN